MEAVAAATAFIYMKKWKNTYWKWFPFYLAFVILSELTGITLARHNMVDINFAYFSYFEIPVEFLFFFWVFHQAFKTSEYNKLPKICSLIYLISLLSDILYFRNYRVFYFSLSYTIGNILLLVLILKYFMELVNSDRVLKFRLDMLFWVSVGLLIYYLGSCPYYGLRNLLVYEYRDLNVYYRIFVDVLNSLMYLTFALGIICGKPNS